jgi:hypothetical protein
MKSNNDEDQTIIKRGGSNLFSEEDEFGGLESLRLDDAFS